MYALAMELDYLEGVKGGHAGIERLLSLDGYTVRHFSKSLEEFIEMLGTTFFFVCFLRYLLLLTPQCHLRVAQGPPGTELGPGT